MSKVTQRLANFENDLIHLTSCDVPYASTSNNIKLSDQASPMPIKQSFAKEMMIRKSTLRKRVSSHNAVALDSPLVSIDDKSFHVIAVENLP